MEKFNVICPDHYPMKCNLSSADKDHLLTTEKYKAFFIFQYQNQDKWLKPTIERYFSERTWRLFNAGEEGGTGTKFCNICRYALASDFAIVSLTPLNHNVFQEIGLMQGFQKPLLYLLNPARKDDLPFDIDDQIYIEHSDKKSLEAGLNKKMPLLIDKVRLLSGFETEQKELIKNKLNKLSPDAKVLLKRIILEGDFIFRTDQIHELANWITNSLKFDSKVLKELEAERFIINETKSGGTRMLTFKRFNEPYRKYLEQLIWNLELTALRADV